MCILIIGVNRMSSVLLQKSWEDKECDGRGLLCQPLSSPFLCIQNLVFERCVYVGLLSFTVIPCLAAYSQG